MALKHRGDWGVYAVAEQQLWRPKGGAWDDGISLFGRISASPSDRSPIDLYVDGGIVFAGLVPGRPDDKFGASAEAVVKGDLSKRHVYYTNSTFLNIAEAMNPIERVRLEGKYHDLIEAGAITHLWLADSRPSKESIANFVVKTFNLTRNAQIAFSPEFTTCNACDRVARGLSTTCPHCGSMDVDGITRVTGYFSRISGWNNGKRAELRDRSRSGIQCA
jgi:anaerobic ribonucleoside-triphosphate reductase